MKKLTYTMHLSELELVLVEDLLDYALDTFEAEDAKTEALFRLACQGLMAKTNEMRLQAGMAPKPRPDTLSLDEATALWLATEGALPPSRVH
jgi:hypothetical protein